MKIYSDDTNLPYRSTTKTPIDSKRDIDAILARYGIKKTGWIWDLEGNNVQLMFELNENFRGINISPTIRLKPPTIWKRQRRGKPEEIDWQLSIRIFHWYIKNQLAMTYSLQSEIIVAFLPHIAISKQENLIDKIIPYLEQINKFKALTYEEAPDPTVD